MRIAMRPPLEHVAPTTGQRTPGEDARVIELGVRCDECGGEGSIPAGRPRRALSMRRCPVCRGEGELIERVRMCEFRALATQGMALSEDS